MNQSLKKIIEDAPLIHSGETEMPDGYQVNTLSFFTAEQQAKMADNASFCWMLGEPVLTYLYENVNPDSRTLEIGSGISTLVFALRNTYHTCITPSEAEINRLKGYAASRQLPMDKIRFVEEYSEVATPRLELEAKLDLLLIDGKHAFPWPFIDWFYTAHFLKKGGLLLIDDTHLLSVQMLSDFLKKDPNWEYLQILDGKTEVFRKLTEDIRNVAWHMQPFVTEHYLAQKAAKRKKPSFTDKVKIKLATLFQ